MCPSARVVPLYTVPDGVWVALTVAFAIGAPDSSVSTMFIDAAATPCAESAIVPLTQSATTSEQTTSNLFTQPPRGER